MKRTIIALLLLTTVLCTGCAERQPATEPAVQTAPAEQTVPTVPATVPETTAPAAQYDGIPVESPCGTLYIPDSWDVPISCSVSLGDPMVMTFLAEDTKLYDLTFSEADNHAIGMVQTGEGIVYIGMTVYPLEGETDMLLSMQESVNELLKQLAPEPVAPKPAATEPSGDIVVDTAYGQLRFPEKWSDYLQTEQLLENAVDFYCCLPEHDPVLLFTVQFGTDEGGPAGVITAQDGVRTKLCILPDEPQFDESWTGEEMDKVYAMQEEMNYLLDNLS